MTIWRLPDTDKNEQGKERILSSMEKVRLGIIGIGNMGSGHCGSILEGKVPDMELAAVADLRESRREWARENLPEDVYKRQMCGWQGNPWKPISEPAKA